MIENLRQEANTFNRRALISLRIIVGLSCIMYGLFHHYLLMPSSFLFLVSCCSIISRITHFFRKNPYFRLLCVSYLPFIHFSYTTSSRLNSQVSFVSFFIQYPINSSTRSLLWPRPCPCSWKYPGKLTFGGHTHLS